MQRLSEFLMRSTERLRAAVVVLEKGAQLTEEQIKEEMLKEMARFKVPERILFLDAIPKTPGLKTDKKYIRTLFQ